MPPDNTETGQPVATVPAPSAPASMTFDQGVDAFVKARTAARATPAATPAPANESVPVHTDSGEASQSGESVETDSVVEVDGNTADEATADQSSVDESAPQLPAPDSVIFTLDDGTPVTAAEAKKSHYRQADYTRDKQGLSEIRNSVQERSALTDQVAKFFADNMPTVIQVLESRIPPEPDAALRNADAFKYWDLYNERQAAIQKLQNARYLEQGSVQANQELSQAQQREQYQIEQDLLLKALPSWRDKKVRTNEVAELTKYATDLGYKPDDLNITDHRIVLMLKDAVEGRKVRQVKNAGNGSKNLPKIAQPTIGARNVVSNVSRGTNASREREQLRQTATGSTTKDGMERMQAAVQLLGPRRQERSRTR